MNVEVAIDPIQDAGKPGYLLCAIFSGAKDAGLCGWVGWMRFQHCWSTNMVILVALRTTDYRHCLAHELDTHQGIASHEQLPALPAAHFLVGTPRSPDPPGRFVAALAMAESWHTSRSRPFAPYRSSARSQCAPP